MNLIATLYDSWQTTASVRKNTISKLAMFVYDLVFV